MQENEENYNYEKELQDIRKIRYNLQNTPMELPQRLELLNILRYKEGLKEEYLGQEKVKCNEDNTALVYNESVKVGIVVTMHVNEAIQKAPELETKKKLYEVMQETYYYLARYLFEYYLVALEFGIPPEKQFLAPRTMVLNEIAKKYSLFYYRTDRPIMTVSMPQGTGKEQPLSSKILTPSGWTTMGEIKIGSEVIGADGKICNVIGVYPKGKKDVYRITFDDHTFVDCGLEHLWEVKTVEDIRNKKEARIVNTKQMLNNYILGKKSKRPYHNYSVRLVKPIEFKNTLERDDLKPYLLGALIGDGGLSYSSCVKFTTADEDILKRIKKELPIKDRIKKFLGENYDYGISSKKTERDNLGHLLPSCQTFIKLKEYGLIGKKSDEKFIPKKYLYSNVDTRLELLRGLMDTDGCVDKRSCVLEFDTTSEQLCYDVLELVRGLGGKANFGIKIGSYVDRNGNRKQCKKVYRINFSLNMNPFYLSRKAQYFKQPKFNFQKKIVNIEKVRQENCQCIMIDHQEHLYVTDGYTLTHNTEIGKRFLSWAIGKRPDLPNMFVSYTASIAKDKGFNGIDAIVNDEMGNFKKIFPKIKEIYRNAETMSLDYADDDRKKPHSEYSLYCVGFDGSVTGRTRAHNILFCDDLVKDIEEASNKDIMDKKWTEFTGTTRKRMQGNCKLLLNGTIFSINDPLSRTIAYYEEKEPSRLMRIKLPGLNENDESNFNYKYGFALTTKALLEDRDLMDPVSFSCLIQQEPIEREGILFFEKEFKKFSLENYERTEGYVRTVAAVDVAWGGDDYLSMPIVDEYENGDCKLIDWYFVKKADKTVTQENVARKIVQYNISRVFFEANNGGDEYRDDVKNMVEEQGWLNCFYDSAKAPTNSSKTDRILARQAEIRGSGAVKYRLVIPLRNTIKGDKMFNEALNQVFKFNQTTAASVRKRQHDDAPDSLASLFTNIFGLKPRIGQAISTISRDMLGI